MSQGFETAALKTTRSAVIETLADCHAFVLVEGVSGSGKTQLKKQLESKLNDRYRLISLPYCRFDVDELLTTLAGHLHLPYTAGDNESCFNAVRDCAKQQERLGNPIALLIDDAQFMPAETLVSLANAVSGDTPLLPLRGVLFAPIGLYQQCRLKHIDNTLLSRHLLLTAPSEEEMRSFILGLVKQESESRLSISNDALQLLLFNAAGSLRAAQQLVKLAVIETEFSGRERISEDAIEQVHTENCFKSKATPAEPPSTTAENINHAPQPPASDTHVSDTVVSGISPLDKPAKRPSGDATLGGLLTASLLDTPTKPVLKKHTDRLDTPLFINDLAAPEVSFQSALAGHEKRPTSTTEQQPSPPGAVSDPRPIEPENTSAATPPQRGNRTRDTGAVKEQPLEEKAAKEQPVQTKTAPLTSPKSSIDQEKPVAAMPENPAVSKPEKPVATQPEPMLSEDNATATDEDRSLPPPDTEILDFSPDPEAHLGASEDCLTTVPEARKKHYWTAATALVVALSLTGTGLLYWQKKPTLDIAERLDQLPQQIQTGAADFQQYLSLQLVWLQERSKAIIDGSAPTPQSTQQPTVAAGSIQAQNHDQSAPAPSTSAQSVMVVKPPLPVEKPIKPTMATSAPAARNPAPATITSTPSINPPATATIPAPLPPTKQSPVTEKQQEAALVITTTQVDSTPPIASPTAIKAPGKTTAATEQSIAATYTGEPTTEPTPDTALALSIDSKMQAIDQSLRSDTSSDELEPDQAVITNDLNDNAMADNESQGDPLSDPYNQPPGNPSASPENQDAEILDVEQAAHLAQVRLLLKKAEIHRKAYRLTIPENDNAVLTYRRILQLEPANNTATTALREISERYRRRAEQAMLQQRWGVAAQNYSRLLWMYPDDPQALAGVTQLKRQMDR